MGFEWDISYSIVIVKKIRPLGDSYPNPNHDSKGRSRHQIVLSRLPTDSISQWIDFSKKSEDMYLVDHPTY